MPEHGTPRFVRVKEPMETPTELIFKVTEAAEGGFDAQALGHSIFT